MIEAYTPTPRRVYTYLAMISGAGGFVVGGLVGYAAALPPDVVAAFAVTGAGSFAWAGLLSGVTAVHNERAAFFRWQEAQALAGAKPAALSPADDVPLKITRAGNVRTPEGFLMIPNATGKAKGKQKESTARRYYQDTKEIITRAVVSGELDGQPARLIIDVTRAQWIMAQNIDRLDWRLGERRWTEGPQHPFSRIEYPIIIEDLIAQHILRRPQRGNIAPAITPSFQAVMEYWRGRPCPARGRVVTVE